MKKAGVFVFALCAVVLFSKCSKNNDDPKREEPKEINYAFAVVGGVAPSLTTYIIGTADLNFSHLGNTNAAEQPSSASMWHYKKAVYVTAFGAPASMVKYEFDDKGIAAQKQKLVVPGANTFSSIEFISDDVAYASVGGGLARVVKFNPTTMQITGEINLNSILKPAATSTFYLGMKARGGKLFLGVYYGGSLELLTKAYMAVINLETDAVEKLIEDERTAAIFQGGSSANGIEVDENGDMYVMGVGSPSRPSGILRIKKDATDFDPDYFMNLDEVTGNSCRNLRLFNNGLAFVNRVVNVADPYELDGANYEFYQIDITNKASKGKVGNLPVIWGSSTGIIRKYSEGELLFSVSGETENAIYAYNIANGSLTKKFTLDGSRTTGFTMLKQ
ncbi:MAG: hypothetical protein KF746_16800 [Chitinophagaceae bacterium]|nr:hypothetical protein [Chitinophagaceae bacterium]